MKNSEIRMLTNQINRLTNALDGHVNNTSVHEAALAALDNVHNAIFKCGKYIVDLGFGNPGVKEIRETVIRAQHMIVDAERAVRDLAGMNNE
jgi:hypothetical protein